MDPSKLLRGKVEWNTTVAYYPLHIAEYATVILASDWLYFSRHGIKYSTEYILVMQLVLSSGTPWNMPRVTCLVLRKHTSL